MIYQFFYFFSEIQCVPWGVCVLSHIKILAGDNYYYYCYYLTVRTKPNGKNVRKQRGKGLSSSTNRPNEWANVTVGDNITIDLVDARVNQNERFPSRAPFRRSSAAFVIEKSKGCPAWCEKKTHHTTAYALDHLAPRASSGNIICFIVIIIVIYGPHTEVRARSLAMKRFRCTRIIMMHFIMHCLIRDGAAGCAHGRRRRRVEIEGLRVRTV